MIKIVHIDDEQPNINNASRAFKKITSQTGGDNVTRQLSRCDIVDITAFKGENSSSIINDTIKLIEDDEDLIIILDLHFTWLNNQIYEHIKNSNNLDELPDYLTGNKIYTHQRGGLWVAVKMIQAKMKSLSSGKLLVLLASGAGTHGPCRYLKEQIPSNSNIIKVEQLSGNFTVDSENSEPKFDSLWLDISNKWSELFETDPLERFINGINLLDTGLFKNDKAHDWMQQKCGMQLLLLLLSNKLELGEFAKKIPLNLISDACLSIYAVERPKVPLSVIWILTYAAYKSERGHAGKIESIFNLNSTLDWKGLSEVYIYIKEFNCDQRKRSHILEILRSYWIMCLLLFKEHRKYADSESLIECRLSDTFNLELLFSWPKRELEKRLTELKGNPSTSLEDRGNKGCTCSRAVCQFMNLYSGAEGNTAPDAPGKMKLCDLEKLCILIEPV